jgi:hypothetical protein
LWPDHIGERLAERAKRRQCAFSICWRARIANSEDQDFLAVHVSGQEWEGRRLAQYHPNRELVRRGHRDLAVPGEESPGPAEWMDDQSRHKFGSDWVQFELEQCHYTEIAAATAYGPEEVGVLRRACVEKFAIGSNHIGGVQIVGGEPKFTTEPAEATAKGESGYTGGRVDPKRRGKAKRLRLLVELAERHSWLYARAALFRVNMDGPHRRQIDQEPTVTDRVARDVVTAAAHRHEQAVVARKAHGINHIACDLTTHDRTWSPIDHCIPNRPRLVVTGFVRQAEAAAELRVQSRQDVAGKRDRFAFKRADSNLVHGTVSPWPLNTQNAGCRGATCVPRRSLQP